MTVLTATSIHYNKNSIKKNYKLPENITSQCIAFSTIRTVLANIAVLVNSFSSHPYRALHFPYLAESQEMQENQRGRNPQTIHPILHPHHLHHHHDLAHHQCLHHQVQVSSLFLGQELCLSPLTDVEWFVVLSST